jgi:hypothetical protein
MNNKSSVRARRRITRGKRETGRLIRFVRRIISFIIFVWAAGLFLRSSEYRHMQLQTHMKAPFLCGQEPITSKGCQFSS